MLIFELGYDIFALILHTIYNKTVANHFDGTVYRLDLNAKPVIGQYILQVTGTGVNEKVKLVVL